MQTKILRNITSAIVMVAFLYGCSISDYPGLPAHRTHGEAGLPMYRFSFAGFGKYLDGTYVYSAKYNNRNWQDNNFSPKVHIYTYRNPVVNSYPHRQNFTVDGGSYNGTRGYSGGEFDLYWLAIDKNPNQFGAMNNFDRRFPLDDNGMWIEPLFILELGDSEHEVDGIDWDLQSNMKNASQLLSSLILNGGKLNQLNLNIVSIALNDKVVNVDNYPLKLSVKNYSDLDLSINNSPELRDLLKKIISNTNHLQPTSIDLTFSNKMQISLPRGMSVAFNHDQLNKIIQQ